MPDRRPQGGGRWIIVGFDPGLTAGIAIMDLEGDLLFLESYKEISKSEIIKQIIIYGKAILIATDVYPPPKMIKKLASALNSKICSPYKTMSVGSKIEIVDNYLKERHTTKYPQNAHEKDALAAAVKTYKRYQNKLNQIERRAQNLDVSEKQLDHIKALVIKGSPISSAIAQTMKVSDITPKNQENRMEEEQDNFTLKNEEIDKRKDEMTSKLKQKIKGHENQIINLKQINNLLKKDIEGYKGEVSKLQAKLEKLYYEYSKDILYKKELSSKIAIIKGLQEKYSYERAEREKLEENLSSIKKIRAMELSKKAVPIKIIESFTKEGIKQACEYWKIKRGDTVLLSSSEGGGSQTAALLIQMGIKAVMVADVMSHQAEEEFEKNLVPILDAGEIDLKIIDEFAIIEDEILNREIQKWNKSVENKRKKEGEKKLIKVIDEYRAQRKRSI